MKDEIGPLIALIVFVILTGVFGTFAYLKQQELEGDNPDRSKSKDAEIAKIKRDIQGLDSDIAQERDKSARYREEIRRQQSLYDLYAEEFSEYGSEYERRRQLVAWADSFEKQAAELSGTVNKLKNDTLSRVNKETTEVREKMEKDLQEKNLAKEAAITRLRQEKDGFDADTKKFRATKNYEQSGLDESKSVLTDLTQREIERADIFNESDGHIVLSDPVHNLAVIDRGTASGVRNGFRFEVYAVKPGNQKLVKGYIEVTRADVSKSECLIVERPVLLPKDPLSGYLGSSPEEMFSPYQESGKKGGSAQPLSGVGKVVMLGKSKNEPIVEGDVIQNPFYSPNKTFTFYIAGAKEIANERQKSAIRYRWTEIKDVIERYGNKVSASADTTVNYVIAQKNPRDGTDAEKAEFQKAVDLGLPVIYEWELFRFLDSK